MFFKECARLAEQYPDLARVFERVDSRLGEMGTAAVIRPDDLSSFLSIDLNQIRSALDLLTQETLLHRVEMIECMGCGMAAPRSDYLQGLDEDDEYRCTSCDRALTDRTIQIITAYQPGEKWQEVSTLRDASGNAGGREASSSSTSNKNPCVFQRGTKVWTLCFDGTTVHVPELAGMNYIAELLRRPRTPIDADTLVGTARESADASAEVSEQRVVMASAAMPGIPMTDAKAIRAVKGELAKRKEELKDCPADDARSAQLQREISQLQNYLAQGKGQHGRPRATGGITSRARSRVKHAIDRAITRIAEQHLPLANHLQNSIRTGNSPVYMPTEVPDWQF